MLRLNGITPVMVTTFREDESIDDEALRHQIDYSIEGGAVAVCGPGYAGEFYKLSDKERYHWVDVLIQTPTSVCQRLPPPVPDRRKAPSSFPAMQRRWAPIA